MEINTVHRSLDSSATTTRLARRDFGLNCHAHKAHPNQKRRRGDRLVRQTNLACYFYSPNRFGSKTINERARRMNEAISFIIDIDIFHR
jgi:hypothetical protein